MLVEQRVLSTQPLTMLNTSPNFESGVTALNIVDIPTVQELVLDLSWNLPEVQVVERIRTQFTSRDMWRRSFLRTAICVVFLRTPVHVAQLVPLLVFVTLDSAQPLTHPDDSSTSALSQLKTVAHPTCQQILCKTLHGSGCADSWDALANMASLYSINPESAYDGQQRDLEDFQFDRENVLNMSQLVGKSAEERNAASVMLDILAGTKNMTTAVGCSRDSQSHTRQDSVDKRCSTRCLRQSLPDELK